MLLKVFILSVIVSLISDIPKSDAALYLVGLILIIIIAFSSIFLSKKQAVINYLIIMLSGRDIWIEGGREVVSIWQQQLMFINPSLIVTIISLIILIKIKTDRIKKYILLVFLIFLLMPLLSGVYSGALMGEALPLEIIVDLKFFIMLTIGLIFSNSILEKKIFTIDDFLKIVFTIFLARHFVDFYYYLIGYGPYFSGLANRVSLDSLKGAVVLLIYYSLFKMLDGYRNIGYISIFILGLILLFAYSTRMLWVTFVLGLLLVVFSLEYKNRIKFIISLPIIVIIFLLMIKLPAFELQYNRLLTLTEGRSEEDMVVNVEYNFISRIDPVRYAQYVNVIYSLKSDVSLFFGKGIGGFYQNYPLIVPNTLEAAYPEYSFETGKYYKTHDMASHIILKFGLIGLFFYIYLYFLSFKGWLKIMNYYSNNLTKAYFCMFPTVMLQFYWSGKNLLFAGVYLCIGFIGLRLVRNVK